MTKTGGWVQKLSKGVFLLKLKRVETSLSNSLGKFNDDSFVRGLSFISSGFIEKK